MKPLLLSPSMTREKLYLYLAVSNIVVSLALIREEENVQKPVYYTSQAFQGAEANYPRMEKITFALVVTSRKLCHYFQAHSIVVMTDQPIRKTMNKIEVVRRLIQWAVWIRPIRHRISASSSNQSPSTGIFYRIIHQPLQGKRTPYRNMDGPNRWVSHEESRRGRSSAHISRERNIEVCS